jgi:hypothetical protein
MLLMLMLISSSDRLFCHPNRKLDRSKRSLVATNTSNSNTTSVAGPVQSSPVQSSPVQSSPVQSSPVQSSPVQSSPVQNKIRILYVVVAPTSIDRDGGKIKMRRLLRNSLPSRGQDLVHRAEREWFFDGPRKSSS